MEVSREVLERFFSLSSPFLDERQRRLLAASMAEVLGRGGQARVAEASGMSRNTVIAGAKELAEGPTLPDGTSRISRETYVRFCESRGVRLRPPVVDSLRSV